MTTLAQDLGGVVRLLEKATPGPWATPGAISPKHKQRI